MGRVVPLDSGGKSASGRRGRNRSKTALVLGGGGFTGGVYEIGALRAFDLLAVDRTVNEFDVYVGTSAGAFVAALTANGVTPEEMMRVLNKNLPSPFPDPELDVLLRPNYKGFLTGAALAPLRMLGMARTLLPNLRELTPMDFIIALVEMLPSGFYTQSGLEDYVAEVLSDPDRHDDFRLLDNELYLPATDLDTCERVILGEGDWADVPISTAVAASGALPMVYAPVDLKGRQLVDGGIRSTTNVDIAVERGAKLILVVNPLVPYVNEFQKRIPTMFGSRAQRVADMGFPYVGYQAFKLIAHARLHQMVQYWHEKYPGVDIILIEPEPNDELMFGTSIMNYSQRLAIARHGFESVTVKLAKDFDHYKEVCARHGIEISMRRVNQVLQQVESDREESSAWRRVLEQTTGAFLRQNSA
ncbi:MAG: patatin-like phospholipase family protein [Solirubrobacterales bacterium]